MINGLLYNFPRTRFVDSNSIVYQLDHIKEELAEAYVELSLMPDVSLLAAEIMDIYHSAETALRILEEEHGVNIRELMHRVAEKNEKRGYYRKGGEEDEAASI
jgi:hypothetical protein